MDDDCWVVLEERERVVRDGSEDTLEGRGAEVVIGEEEEVRAGSKPAETRTADESS